MIPDNSAAVIGFKHDVADWQLELAQAITDPAVLLATLELSHLPGLIDAARQAAQLFPLKVTRSYLSRIRLNDLHDPLLRQILPLGAETMQQAGYSSDPVGDLQSMPVPGLLHKYHGRVLLVTTGTCAIHCRYCFRREFPYQANNPVRNNARDISSYLQNDTSIQEVILSGGDPLTLSDRRLAELFTMAGKIPHIKRIRIHSRLPVILPSRINQNLLDAIYHPRLQTIMVIHANHPNEIDTAVRTALEKLHLRHIPLFNQAVLLRGINDSAATLAALCETLFAAHTLPYYLHLLDKVAGAAHFEVSAATAVSIMAQLKTLLPGYMVPALVQEKAGAPFKIPV